MPRAAQISAAKSASASARPESFSEAHSEPPVRQAFGAHLVVTEEEKRTTKTRCTQDACAPRVTVSRCAQAFGWKQAFVIAGCCAAAALAARLIYLFEYSRDPTFGLLLLDAEYNEELARKIASGAGAPPIPFFRPPGYVYFLALMRAIFPEGLLGIRSVQIILGALGCGLTSLWAGRLFEKPAAAWIAGIIQALYGPLIIMDAELLSPVLILPLNALWMICLGEALRSRGWGWWIAGGFIAGVSALVRPDVVPVAAGCVFAIWLFRVREDGNSRQDAQDQKENSLGALIPRAAAFGAAAALAIAPCALRNLVIGKEFVAICTSGGVNFYIGNHAGADGFSVILPEKTEWSGGWEDYRLMAEREAGRTGRTGRTGGTMTYREAAAHYYTKGLGAWRDSPGAMTVLTAKKLVGFWHGVEWMNSRDDYVSRLFSWLAALLLWLKPLYFPFGLLGPLALGGAIHAWRKRPAARLAIMYVIIYWVVAAAFFVTGRFRLPIIPACAVLASGWMAQWLEDWLTNRPSRTGKTLETQNGLADSDLSSSPSSSHFSISRHPHRLPIAFAAVGLILANFPYPWLWKPSPKAQHAFMAGTALEKAGRHAEAIPWLEQAARLDPELGDARLFLADALRAQGDFARAEAIYREMAASQPGNASLLTWLGEAVSVQGRIEEARRHFEKAIQINPNLFDARMDLGVLLLQSGQEKSALEQFQAADAIKPSPAAKTILAGFLVSEGRLEEAKEFYAQALGLNPDFGRAHLGLAEIYLQQKDAPRAREHLEKALAAGESSPRAHRLAAQLGIPAK